jgi:hypothetical protein
MQMEIVLKTQLKTKIENLTNKIKKAIMECNKLSMTNEQFTEFEQIFKSYDMVYNVDREESYNPYYLDEIKITLLNDYVVYFKFINSKIDLFIQKENYELYLIKKSVVNKCYENANMYFKQLFNVKELNLIDIFKCVDYFGDDEVGGQYTNGIRNKFYQLCKYEPHDEQGYNIVYSTSHECDFKSKYDQEIFKLIADIKINKMNEYKKAEFLNNFEYQFGNFTIDENNNIKECYYYISSKDEWFEFEYTWFTKDDFKYLNIAIEEYREKFPEHKFLYGADIVENILV